VRGLFDGDSGADRTPGTYPSSHRYEEGELRVIAIGPTFESLLADAFDQIRGSAKGNVAIMLRMLGRFKPSPV
jgi:uncharacterized membrane protein